MKPHSVRETVVDFWTMNIETRESRIADNRDAAERAIIELAPSVRCFVLSGEIGVDEDKINDVYSWIIRLSCGDETVTVSAPYGYVESTEERHFRIGDMVKVAIRKALNLPG